MARNCKYGIDNISEIYRGEKQKMPTKYGFLKLFCNRLVSNRVCPIMNVLSSDLRMLWNLRMQKKMIFSIFGKVWVTILEAGICIRLRE
ncbi:hypothetical protein D3C81_1697960 [compost metagenome]